MTGISWHLGTEHHMDATQDDRSRPTIVARRRYRLVLSTKQEARLVSWAGALRALWNAALEQRQMAWRLRGQSVDMVAQCRDLTEARAEFPWLADVPAQVAQQTLRDLDRAFARFFVGLARHPRWRSRRRQMGLRFPQGVQVRKVNRRWGEVKLLKLGWCRFRLSRELDGEVRHATVRRDALGWHITFCVATSNAPREPNGGAPIGIDRGVVATVATSDGRRESAPRLRRGQAERLRRLRRRAGRQETARGRHSAGRRRRSHRHQRTLDQIARLMAREARIRSDFLHNLSIWIASTRGMVAVERLDIVAMTRSAKGTVAHPGTHVRAKAGLNRAILERGWGQMRRQLRYKCHWYGSQLIEVSAAHTSLTCSLCGTMCPESRESQARFSCRACGHTDNADINAARVILARALALTAEGSSVAARGGLAVRRPAKREPTQRMEAA
jgi:putative transposase